MLQKTIVYVSRITNLSDARYCAGMGVDLLGYVVDPGHDDYVSQARYQEMVGWISGPGRVIEITTLSLDLTKLVSEYLPDAIHIPLDLVHQYKLPDLPLMVSIPFHNWQIGIARIQQLKHNIKHVIVTGFLDTESPVTFMPLAGTKILLSLESDSGPLAPLLKKTKADGFALHGSRELAPGLKDYEHLARVLEELEG
jgi:phosphoribosylanthranilate isomerase